MNILNISTLDTGGAGDYAVQMNDLFRGEGYNSFLVVRNSTTNNKNIVQVIDNPEIGSFKWIGNKTKRWVQKKVNGISRKKLQTHFDYYFFQNERDEYVSAKRILRSIPFKPDIIFLYWTSEFIAVKTIHKLYKYTGARIFWMMMDNAPITGGCHYPWDCKGYQTNCSNCPAIIEANNKSVAMDNLALKHKFLPSSLTFIAFSEQDFRRARIASLCRDRKAIKIIGFADENKYKPGNRGLAKIHFGIDPESKVLFFGASRIKEKRKGLDSLMKAFTLLKGYFIENQIALIYAGLEKIDIDDLPINCLGFLTEDELILAYQAAEVFVCPSIEDSGPMMINQSLMCGTPVVAFESGVAIDLVENGKNGYLARINDFNDLANGIKIILEIASPLKEEYYKGSYQTGIKNSGKEAFIKFNNEILNQV